MKLLNILLLGAIIVTKSTAVESSRTFIYNVVNVERVVDGDTCIVLLDLGFNIFYKADVRLLTLDTPEKNTKEGKIVKSKVENWFKGKTLVLESRDLDKFGRVLGEIRSVDGESLNLWLVKEGFARVYMGEKKVPWTNAQIQLILSKEDTK